MDRPHICKICNKRFKGGKAMGGHMRSHLAKLPLPPKQPPPPPPPTTPSPPQRLSHSPEFSSSTSTLHHHSSSILRIRNINSSVMQMMMMQSPPPPQAPAPAAEYHPKPFPKYREVVAPSSMDSAVESDSTESHPKNPTRRRSKRRRKLIVKVALAERPPTPQEAEQQQVSSVSDTFSTEDCALSLMMLSRDKWKVKNEDQSVEEEDEMVQEMEEEDDVVFRAKSSPRTSNSQGKYKCETCKKVFQSYQALGGHRASHKRVRQQVFEDDDDDVDGGDDSEEEEEEEEEGNRNGINGGKGEGYNGKSAVVEHPPPRSFECPFCFKLFDSGQALGGHKKVHYYNNTSYYNNSNNNNMHHFSAAANTNNNNNARASSSSANFGDNLVIDLNFPPAPEEEFEFSTVSD